MLRVDWVARNLSQTGRRGSEFRRVGETPAAQGSLELGVAAGAPRWELRVWAWVPGRVGDGH